MKIYFSGNDVQMKTEQPTNLTKKQVEAVKQYAKKYIKELINKNKIK